MHVFHERAKWWFVKLMMHPECMALTGENSIYDLCRSAAYNYLCPSNAQKAHVSI